MSAPELEPRNRLRDLSTAQLAAMVAGLELEVSRGESRLEYQETELSRLRAANKQLRESATRHKRRHRA